MNDKKTKSLYKAFCVMFISFIVLTLIISVLSIYLVQRKLYHDQYKSLLQSVNASFIAEIQDDIEDFSYLQEYFKENKDLLEIPFNYPKNVSAERDAFLKAFSEKYPGKIFPSDISFRDLDDETKLLYAKYKYIYWINVFDRKKEAFGLDYAYYIYPMDKEDYMCYMFDGPREETIVNGKSLLLLGYEAYEDRDKHKNMWITYETAAESEEMDVYDNDFGHVYTFSSPVIYNGEVLGLVLTDISFNNVSAMIRATVTGLTIILIIVLGIFSALMLQQVRKLIILRIISMQKLVNEYSATKDVAIANKLSEISTQNDELGVLGTRFSEMITSLEEYMDNLQKVTAERERIGAELNVATEIQASMLPRLFPAFPNRSEFNLFASMDPAKEVGGDFYDFFMTDDSHIVLVMADVSGKGVPAALFMAISKALIKDNAQLSDDPAEILKKVNSQLCESNDAELFVTVWLGIVDLKTGNVKFCDAGHEYPVLIHDDGTHELIKPVKKRMPVGTLEGIKYTTSEFTIIPGDVLFLYTDGVPEATNANNELYGMDRLNSFFEKSEKRMPVDILKAISSDVDNFVGEAQQFDDLTMLGFRMNKYYEESDSQM